MPINIKSQLDQINLLKVIKKNQRVVKHFAIQLYDI